MSIAGRLGRYLLAVLAVTVVVLMAAPAGTANAAGGGSVVGTQGQSVGSMQVPTLDCKEAPLPAMPAGAMGEYGALPPLIYAEDPFENPDIPLHAVYGWNYELFTYDTGCGPGAGFVPDAATSISNLMLGETAKGASVGHAINSAVLNPVWLEPIDDAVADGVEAVRNATWLPWLGVSVLIVAVLMLWAVRTGVLDVAVTTAVWALLVPGVVSVVANYPEQTTEAMDGVVQGSANAIVSSFTDPIERPGDPVDPKDPVRQTQRVEGTTSGDTAPQAPVEDPELQMMVDKQWDNIMRNTYWNTWVRATFGDTESPTAQKYAVPVFQATHLSWLESITMKAIPGDEFFEKYVAEKQEEFSKLAAEIKESDPYAYEFFTGNRWGQRIGQASTGAVAGVLAMLFLLVAGIGMFLGFVVIRLAAMFAPAAGVIFLVEKTRNIAIGFVQKIGRYVVMGPVFLLAGLVVLLLNSAIADSTAAWWMKIGLFLVVSWLAWSLIRPVAGITGGGFTKRMFRTMVGTWAGMKLARGGGKKSQDKDQDDEDEDEDDNPGQEPKPRDQPVFQPRRRPGLMPNRRPALPASTTGADGDQLAEYPVVAGQDQDQEGRVFQSATRGLSTRRARQLSAADPAAPMMRALGPGRTVQDEENPAEEKGRHPVIGAGLEDTAPSRQEPGEAAERPVPGDVRPVSGDVVATEVTVVSNNDDQQSRDQDGKPAAATTAATGAAAAGAAGAAGGAILTSARRDGDIPSTSTSSPATTPAAESTAGRVPVGVVTVHQAPVRDSEQPRPEPEDSGVAGGAITPAADQGTGAWSDPDLGPTGERAGRDGDVPPTSSSSPGAGDQLDEVTSQRVKPPVVEGEIVDGSIGPVHEANVTYDSSGHPVFTVYRPGGRSVIRDA